jgi:general secretion pathway protein N
VERQHGVSAAHSTLINVHHSLTSNQHAMASTPRLRTARSPANAANAAPWVWAAAGLLLGALWAALYYAPAAWLAQAALSASEGRLVLHDSRGTLWQGSAQLGVSGGQGSRDAARLPGRVQWDVRPALDGVHIALSADCCTQQAQQLVFTPGLRSWRLTLAAGASTWPAALLAGLGTPWNTVQLQGMLRLSTPGLSLQSALQRTQVEGQLSLELPDLQSRLSTLRPLGSYRLQMQGGEQPRLDLHTERGSLQLQGAGQWTAGHLRFTGEAWTDSAHEAELANLLNIMGRRNGARSVITLG